MMQKIVFIRHSEPDYTFVNARNFIGHGKDLSQLTENGIQIAENSSHDDRLKGAEIIVSSPYTRALQTAAILSKNTNLSIKIEIDLIEWMPDLTFQYSTVDVVVKAARLLRENKGACPINSEIQYEDLESVFQRAKNALLRYKQYHKIIVVTHEMVIRCFVASPQIPFCSISEVDFDESFTCTELNPQ